jgi:hypothetical protein
VFFLCHLCNFWFSSLINIHTSTTTQADYDDYDDDDGENGGGDRI